MIFRLPPNARHRVTFSIHNSSDLVGSSTVFEDMAASFNNWIVVETERGTIVSVTYHQSGPKAVAAAASNAEYWLGA